MAIRKGLPAKLALTDADDTRYLFSGLVVCNVDGSPRGGVLSPVGTSLVTATATMSVSVARFQGAAVRDGGVVLLANDGAVNVLLDAAPGANSRIDVIYAKQNDSSVLLLRRRHSSRLVLVVLFPSALKQPWICGLQRRLSSRQLLLLMVLATSSTVPRGSRLGCSDLLVALWLV